MAKTTWALGDTYSDHLGMHYQMPFAVVEITAARRADAQATVKIVHCQHCSLGSSHFANKGNGDSGPRHIQAGDRLWTGEGIDAADPVAVLRALFGADGRAPKWRQVTAEAPWWGGPEWNGDTVRASSNV